ncbi:hypothetical protein EV682_107126 [Iodobacter fluviatilis]|uniref:Uncharacterized protein n=1 Tax=Iodobacter fluviatilis TaxID=537 RepID=A0A377SX92_9NEIS|nr:hypothetical protein EV682_107126 [Iodobacter fluviatilis]STR44936.1 Uncharacterised protein [Iodobacter fluviatilis]
MPDEPILPAELLFSYSAGQLNLFLLFQRPASAKGDCFA